MLSRRFLPPAPALSRSFLAGSLLASSFLTGLCAAPALAAAPPAPPLPAPPASVAPARPAPAKAPAAAETSLQAEDPTLFAPLPPLQSFNVDPARAEDAPAPPAREVKYALHVEGLDKINGLVAPGMPSLEAQFSVLSALGTAKKHEGTPAQILARMRADATILEKILESEGWYDATVDTNFTPFRAKGVPATSTDIRLTATPGPRYSWENIHLPFLPADMPELKKDFLLKPGAPVRAAEVEAAEGKLLLSLQDRGYPFAKIGERDILLSATAPTADYTLQGDTGPKGVFGPIRLHRFQPFSAKHAAVIARFKEGDPYNAALVDDLRRALIETQLFGGVGVGTKDSGKRDAEGRAITDVNIYGSKGPERLLSGRLGYSTGEGARLEALWRHRNLVEPEGQFTARGVIGTIEQALSGELAMSNWHRRDQTLSLLGEFSNTKRPAYQARTLTFGATLSRSSTRLWQKPITWSLGSEVIATDERDRSDPLAESRQKYFIVALPAMVGWDTSDDLLNPTKGTRFTLWATPEFSRSAGHSSTYGRLLAQATGYQSFGEKFVLAGRLKGGTIIGADRLEIAPTRRLYVGGGGSVRGFSFQQVGPHDADDRPTGGRGLLEGSIEGRYRMGTMGIVGFVDAGTLTENVVPTLSHVYVGAGVGFRYYTDFGPIRIDIARAITEGSHAPKIGLYISIGQAF